MTQIRYEKDADLSLIRAKKVAVIGYGSQGHAHSLNLKESGVNVRVGLQKGSKSKAKAEAAGLTVKSVADAAKEADVIMILAPDTAQPAIYTEHIAPNLEAGNMLMFAHGFNIRYGTIEPPKEVDVTMVAPKSPGHRVRETYQEGGGVPALLAILLKQDRDAARKSPHTIKNYRSDLGRFNRFVVEKGRPVDIPLIRDYLASLKILAPATRARHQSALRSFFQWCY